MKVDQNMCRLCTKVLSGVFFKTIDSTMRTKIEEILRIETLLKDPYNHICLPCSNSVNNFYNFFVEIQAAQSFFENKEPDLLMEIKIEEENEVSVEPVAQNTNEVVGDYSIVEEETLEEGEIAVVSPKRKPRPKARLRKAKDSAAPRVPCPECGVLFKKSTLWHHMQLHQERTNMQCDICNLICISRTSLLTHMRTQHLPKKSNLDQFLCNICAKSYETRERFMNHMRYAHDDRKAKCPDCDLVLAVYKLRNHQRTIHDTKKVTCPICQKEFQNNARLRGHKIKVHVEPKYECDICQKKYKAKDMMQNHRSTHFNELRFKCDLCDYMNNDYGNMTKHRKTKHRDVPYPAPGTARKIFEIARH